MLTFSTVLNIIFVSVGVLTWFKVPDMILEHYKSHLAEITQQKEAEFKQKAQQQQHDFEHKLQTTLAEQEREFEQKADLLKQRRAILPVIYAKLLELNGVIRDEENTKKRDIQVLVNNYIESNQLFLTEPLYKQIKSTQESMNSLSAIYENMPHLFGEALTEPNKKRESLEREIEQKLNKLKSEFITTIFDK